ncbi:MAG: thioredoxin domain-containing protein [Candidatus Aenigmarchaeota archaeon]|nr:thioredoxin domain-containing protein [Candidatus Aenigmarchaeota archaeon]
MPTIAWLEWGKPAFEKSRAEGKPILLDIHGVWCHWCHVMENATYANPAVAKKVNSAFVAVKVDTDRRPDINERYNQGGWPTTAFLNHKGELLTGFTYLPAGQMLQSLAEVASMYHEFKDTASGYGGQELKQTVLDRNAGEMILDRCIEAFDLEYGGFGFHQKFPMAEQLELLLHFHRKRNSDELLRLAEKSGQGIMAGLYDKHAGGFFRYATQRDWSAPHYEKMLETNAELVRLFTELHKITDKTEYFKVAEHAASFMSTTLCGKAFYGSQDADGEEKYYGLNLENRDKLPIPFIDQTVYVDLNGKAIVALLNLWSASHNPGLKEKLLSVLGFLAANCYDRNQGMAHCFSTKPATYGLLADNLWMAKACLLAGRRFSLERYNTMAEQLLDFILKRFPGQDGGFIDRLAQPDDVGRLKVPLRKITENAELAMLLLDFAPERPELGKVAEQTLALFASSYEKYGLMAAGYSLAVEKLLAAKETQ